MKLLLSQADKEEIAAAYKKAKAAARESADSLNALAEMLEQKIACLDKRHEQQLGEQFNLAGSGLFKIKVARCKVNDANFQGREFLDSQDASVHELQ